MSTEKKQYSLISVEPSKEALSFHSDSSVGTEKIDIEKAKVKDVIKVEKSAAKTSLDVIEEDLNVQRHLSEQKTEINQDSVTKQFSAFERDIPDESISKKKDVDSDKQFKKDVKQIMEEEMKEQLGEAPNVPFARMRYIIVIILILFLIGFGFYFFYMM